MSSSTGWMKKEKSSLSSLFLSLWDIVLRHGFAIHVGVHAQVILGSTPVPGLFKGVCHEGLAVVRARVGVCLPQLSGPSLPPLDTQSVPAPLTNSITDNACVKHKYSAFLTEVSICLQRASPGFIPTQCAGLRARNKRKLIREGSQPVS